MSASAEVLSVRPRTFQDVRPFPPVAARLLNLISAEEFSYKKISDVVRTDAAFSGELLRLANSPFFGFRYEIKDIPHAVAVLGINHLRAVITTLAMREFIAPLKRDGLIRRIWRHNLATAMAGEVLAGAFWIDSGLGYTAGLLHDIGLMAMAMANLDDYAALIDENHVGATEFLERERALFGIDHCEAGRLLLAEWGLPSEFLSVAAHHHDPPGSSPCEVVGLGVLSCLSASMAGFPAVCTHPEWDPEFVISRLPEKMRDRFHHRLDDLPMTIATKINFFECDFLR